jgi:hypothetical protein
MVSDAFLRPTGDDDGRIHRVRTICAAGTAVWSLSLLLALVVEGVTVRQIAFLLFLAAAFGSMVLWTSWRLWTRERGGAADAEPDDVRMLTQVSPPA